MKAISKKKAVSALCLAAMALSFASCGSATSGSSQAASSSGSFQGDYSETRTISLAVLDNVTDEQWENDFHKFFKEKFNIEWDYNYVEWGSWDEKLRVWINSDDLPDVSIWNYNYTDFENYVNQGLLYEFPAFHVLAGGAILGAVFMATDYSTSPMTVRGGVIYAVGIGVITMCIRLWGAYPEGMSFAILVMNATVPLINRSVKPKRFGAKK